MALLDPRQGGSSGSSKVHNAVLEMLTIPGLRAEKVIKLCQELGLTSVEELEEAARQGKLQKVKGLGASLQTKILRGLELGRAAGISTRPTSF